MKAAIDTQNGFTLIELMAVVAIVSILSMVAMATYADYVTRSKVGEGLVFASEAKTSVTEYYYNNQKWPKNNSQAGLPAADSYDQNFEYIKSLEVATSEPYGVITITFKLTGTKADNKQLQLIPNTKDTVVYWSCKPPRENGIDTTQVPPNCRG
ncbi:MAG: pilin [Haliea sp.]|jgi:type IV pilus assembly protein PilA|nr:pilin [Haliea sp.]MBK6736932.1 pilin [Haliea sp.]